MEKAPNEQRDRKFETLFDGDEIDGKVYKIGRGVTNLDGPTGDYLVLKGRLAEIDDERFEAIEAGADGEDDDFDASELDAGEDDALEVAKADFAAGRIPDDLIDGSKPADDADRLIGKAELVTLATDEKATFKPAWSKADIAVAIMAVRSNG